MQRIGFIHEKSMMKINFKHDFDMLVVDTEGVYLYTSKCIIHEATNLLSQTVFLKKRQSQIFRNGNCGFINPIAHYFLS